MSRNLLTEMYTIMKVNSTVVNIFLLVHFETVKGARLNYFTHVCAKLNSYRLVLLSSFSVVSIIMAYYVTLDVSSRFFTHETLT